MVEQGGRAERPRRRDAWRAGRGERWPGGAIIDPAVVVDDLSAVDVLSDFLSDVVAVSRLRSHRAPVLRLPLSRARASSLIQRGQKWRCAVLTRRRDAGMREHV